MLIKNLLKYFSLPVFLFVISDCSDNTSSNAEKPNDLIPLKKGNTWNYIIHDYQKNDTINYIEKDKSKIVDETFIQNQKWYSYGDLIDIWYTNKSDGVWEYSSSSYLGKDTSILLFKYPASAGDMYNSTKVISINEIITVPAGMFYTIHYSQSIYTSNYSGSLDTYIVPGIGVIKQMQIENSPDGPKYVVYQRELESYSLLK